MSDFLSNFSGDNYQKTREQKETKKQKKTTEMTLDEVNKIKKKRFRNPKKRQLLRQAARKHRGMDLN